MLTEDEQNIAVALLDKLGIHGIINAIERETRRQLKVIYDAFPHVLRRIIKEPEEKFIELIKNSVRDLTGYSPETETVKTYLDNLISLDFTPLAKSTGTENKAKTDHKNQNEKVYTYSVHNAEARMVIRAGSYVVLKDSTAIKEEKKSIPDNTHKRRGELITSGVLVKDKQSNLLRFTVDVPFDSPSAASNIISASSTNGWRCFSISHENS